MAIKTKKISELDTLTIGTGDTSMENGGILFLCTKTSGATGKLSSKTLFETVHKVAEDECLKLKEELQKPNENPNPTSVATASIADNSEISALKTAVDALTKSLNDLSVKYKNFTFNQSDKNSSYIEQINVLNEKVASLEGFVQALQKDGYLTLKEIQRAAANACPICTHTHEETAE